jgi:hypothetical protein
MSLKKRLRRRFEAFQIFGELWHFMRVRKKWWLGPVIVVLVLLGVFMVLTQGTVVAPFIYTLF